MAAHEVVISDTFSSDRVRLECVCGWSATGPGGPEARRLALAHEALNESPPG
jgi:hypothetical protein